MKEEIIIAGFGGQGVLSMGKILAYSGLFSILLLSLNRRVIVIRARRNFLSLNQISVIVGFCNKIIVIFATIAEHINNSFVFDLDRILFAFPVVILLLSFFVSRTFRAKIYTFTE